MLSFTRHRHELHPASGFRRQRSEVGEGLIDPPLGACGTHPHRKQTAKPYLCWKVLNDFNQVLAALWKRLVYRVGFQAGLGDRANQNMVSTLLEVRLEVQVTGGSQTRKARVIPTREKKGLVRTGEGRQARPGFAHRMQGPGHLHEGGAHSVSVRCKTPLCRLGLDLLAFGGAPGRPSAQSNVHRKVQGPSGFHQRSLRSLQHLAFM